MGFNYTDSRPLAQAVRAGMATPSAGARRGNAGYAVKFDLTARRVCMKLTLRLHIGMASLRSYAGFAGGGLGTGRYSFCFQRKTHD